MADTGTGRPHNTAIFASAKTTIRLAALIGGRG